MLERTIWMLWLQGWENAPEISRASLRTWRRANPSWSVRALTASDIPEVLDGDDLMALVPGRRVQPTAYANLIRTALLRRYGGVWADSTTIVSGPSTTGCTMRCHAAFSRFRIRGRIACCPTGSWPPRRAII